MSSRIIRAAVFIVAGACAAARPVLGADTSRPANETDDLTAAKAAEQSVHSACDEWSAAQAKGQDVSAIATRIERSYRDFFAHVGALDRKGRARILFIATGVRPTREIIFAGTLPQSNGAKYSLLIWRSRNSVLMSAWGRGDWETTTSRSGVITYAVHVGGRIASLTIKPDDLGSRLTVGQGAWEDGKPQQVLRVPYKLDGRAGVIEIRRSGDKWRMVPDSGVVKPNGEWWPLLKADRERPG